MSIEAINVIEIHAVRGQADTLKLAVLSWVEALREASGCLSYSATLSPANKNLWIVTGHWESRMSMESHFKHPALNDVTRFLEARAVSRIAVSSFTQSMR